MPEELTFKDNWLGSVSYANNSVSKTSNEKGGYYNFVTTPQLRASIIPSMRFTIYLVSNILTRKEGGKFSYHFK